MKTCSLFQTFFIDLVLFCPPWKCWWFKSKRVPLWRKQEGGGGGETGLCKFLFFLILQKILIACFTKFSSNFAKFWIILSQFHVSQNFDNAVLQPPYVGVEWGGGAVPPWRTLCPNADCSLLVFPLYCFPFCYLYFYGLTQLHAIAYWVN